MSIRRKSVANIVPAISFAPVARGTLQRKCDCGNHMVAGERCDACNKKRMSLRRDSDGAAGGPLITPSIVHDVLGSPGQPLDAATRAFFEPRFGYDFSQVRLHTDARAAESARAVNAAAYTVGRDVVFGSGQYATSATGGRKLLAHELTHVVQQQGTAREASPRLRVSAGDSSAERDAEAYSASLGEGRPPPHTLPLAQSDALLLQRQPLGGGEGSMDDEGTLLWESFRQSVTLDNFDSDKAMLKPEHVSKLKEFKERFQILLGRYPDSFISVIGHTDATDTEEHNKTLGQDRADAVKTELTSGNAALPAEIVHAGSLGESMLAVDTKGREARNRRVEIIPRLRRSLKLPLPKPPQPSAPFPGVSGEPEEHGRGPGPSVPGGPAKIPNLTMPQKNWLEDALKNDPIIKSLPDWARNKVIDALKDGDEMLAEKIIDALPLDDKTKSAVQAVAKSLLQMAKGKKFKVPESPSRQPDFGPKPEFPKMPGEVIIPGPTFRF
jgi:outer membrane protein OmpA-like peptidoglycan-associated protein